VAVLVLALSACLPGWQEQVAVSPDAAPGSRVALTDIACGDATHCVAVGGNSSPPGAGARDRAVVLATVDGRTWARQPGADALPALRSVDCVDALSCVAVGESVLAGTADGGVSWTVWASTERAVFRAVSCAAERVCVAAASMDFWGADIGIVGGGGAALSVRMIFGQFDDLDCTSEGQCMAVSTEYNQPKFSVDSGRTWTVGAGRPWPAGDGQVPYALVPPPLFVHPRGRVSYSNQQITLHGVSCSTGGACTVAVTETLNWVDFYYEEVGPWGVLVPVNEEHSVVDDVVARTVDGGATWTTNTGTKLPATSGSDEHSVTCVDADHCWVGGRSTVAATGNASYGRFAVWEDQFLGVDADSTVAAMACVDRDRCWAAINTSTGAVVRATANGGVAAPVVNALTPSSGDPRGGTEVNVEGHGFADVTGVRFGETPAVSFRVIDDDHLVAVAPPGRADAPVSDVVVDSPHGPSRATAATRFSATFPVTLDPSPTGCGEYLAQTGQVPALESTACRELTITGTGFLPGSFAPGSPEPATRVTFGAEPALAVTCPDTRTCTVVPPDDIRVHLNQTVELQVATPGGTAAHPFTFGPLAWLISYAETTPMTYGVAPEAGGTVAYLTGQGLDAVTGVDVGTQPAHFTVENNWRVSFVVPPGTGYAPVTLITAAGRFLMADPTRVPVGLWVRYLGPPTITALTPTGERGDTIEIMGTNLAFDGKVRVAFGVDQVEGDCRSYEAACTVMVPSGTGTVPVTVETVGGRSDPSPVAQFTFTHPEVTAITPTSGPSGTLVTFTGRDLGAMTHVHIYDQWSNYNSASELVSVTPEQVTFRTPPIYAPQKVRFVVGTRVPNPYRLGHEFEYL
jgi:hypothetical protein